MARQASVAEALLLTCLDYRLPVLVGQYMEGRGLARRYDQVILAGASLAVTHPEVPAWNQTFLDHVQAALDLHGIRQVMVLDHRDCGAFRVWLGQDFAQDPAAERRAHLAYLEAARERIQERWPDLEVELLLMGLDGSVEQLG